MLDRDGYRPNVGILLLNAHNGPMIPQAFRPRFLHHSIGDFLENERGTRARHGEKESDRGESKRWCKASS